MTDSHATDDDAPAGERADCLIWWTSKDDRHALRQIGIPEYIQNELRSRLGRCGHGRLWIPGDLPDVAVDEGVVLNGNTVAMRIEAEDRAGIVFRREDLGVVGSLPGFVTNLRLEIVSKTGNADGVATPTQVEAGSRALWWEKIAFLAGLVLVPLHGYPSGVGIGITFAALCSLVVRSDLNPEISARVDRFVSRLWPWAMIAVVVTWCVAMFPKPQFETYSSTALTAEIDGVTETVPAIEPPPPDADRRTIYALTVLDAIEHSPRGTTLTLIGDHETRIRLLVDKPAQASK